MKDTLVARLETLQREFDVGQRRLQELERQQSQLRETLLRISGAIQVLEEVLAEGQVAKGHSEEASKPTVIDGAVAFEENP